MCSTDPFLKKEWYDIKAPGIFANRNVGKTLITRTTGTSEYGAGAQACMLRVAEGAAPINDPCCCVVFVQRLPRRA